MEKKNKAITSRDVDFAKWYTDIVTNARLASYSKVKGFTVIEPNGYALWENIQSVLDKRFKELGHRNVQMPLLIPESLLNIEKDHVEGFAPEVAWVTMGGSKELEERMCIRPTSEVLFCDYFATAIKSHRDLPMLYNQWCNIVRWEKETRPFLRTREILWQEGHTMHETAEEAEHETYQMLNVYKELFENHLAIPVMCGRKTEKEKFAGAEYTLTIEALMYNGISLQSGTSHYFGQRFAKAFDVKFNKNNVLEYPHQTSWGVTTRIIGAIIMVHGDDNGLVLPPRIAPNQVVIVPINKNEKVMFESKRMHELLSSNGVRSFIDASDRSPGFKFAEHEMNGIPIRIEIGPRDLEAGKVTLVRRDDNSKQEYEMNSNIVTEVKNLMNIMHNDMFDKALKRNEEKTHICKTLDEMKKIMDEGPGFIKAMWCGDEACELKVKEIQGMKSRCILEDAAPIDKKCVCCDKEGKHLVIWGLQY